MSCSDLIGDPLIEAAVRPLADNAEMQLAAAAFLQGIRRHEPQQEGAAIAVWARSESGHWCANWKVALCGVLALVSAFVGITKSGDAIRYYQWASYVRGDFLESPPDFRSQVYAKLDASQRLLVLGDESTSDEVGKKEALWRSDPENPAYFSEYAVAHLKIRGSLPPGFLETARKIDPQNAWFLYLAASLQARGAVIDKDPPPGASADAISWQVKDRTRLDEALRLIHEAGMLKTCEDYSAEMLSKRLAVLPNSSCMQNMESVSILAADISMPCVHLMHVLGAVSAQASHLSESGDAEGFRQLSKESEAFLRGICSKKTATLIEQVICFGFVKSMSKGFAGAAERLKLPEESEKWEGIRDRAHRLSEIRKSREFMVDGRKADPAKVSGRFFGTTVESIANYNAVAPELTDDVLRPGRIIDHEILSRASGYALWILSGLLLFLMVLFRLRTPRMLRCLAKRVVRLLRISDWGWILGLGVLLPFVSVLAINRFTPLGGRDFGMSGTAMLLPAGHFLALFLLWCIAPVMVVRHRLAVRAGFLGFAKPGIAEWVVLACALGFVFAIGWCGRSGMPGGFWERWMTDAGLIPFARSSSTSSSFRSALVLFAVPLVWVAVIFIRSFHGSRVFQAAAALRILEVTQAFAMLLILLATFGFEASERYWFRQDRLMRFDPAFPGWTRYEFEVADQMRKESLEVLGIAP